MCAMLLLKNGMFVITNNFLLRDAMMSTERWDLWAFAASEDRTLCVCFCYVSTTLTSAGYSTTVLLLAIHPYAGQHFPGPRQADGAHSVGGVTGLFLVMLQDTCVCEICGRVQIWKHGALNTSVNDEQSIR